MSQTVKRLTTGGYATRERDPADGRRVRFGLTAAGAAIADASRQRRQCWLNAQLDQLTADQRRVLAAAAQILCAIADS